MWLRIGVIILGGILGFAYYYFIGCRTGTCPITSSPWISTFYGGLIGLIIAWPSKKEVASSESQPEV